jgi:hypothetical protein
VVSIILPRFALDVPRQPGGRPERRRLCGEPRFAEAEGGCAPCETALCGSYRRGERFDWIIATMIIVNAKSLTMNNGLRSSTGILIIANHA